MEFINTKEVRYIDYCKHCKYWAYSEDEDPCYNCLCEPMAYNSQVPSEYKWDEIGENPIQPKESDDD